MKKKVILTDCDGVLLDWYSRFIQFYTETIEELVTLNTHETILEFNRRGLPLKPMKNGSIEFLKKFKENGFEIHVLSSYGESNHKLREIQLNHVFGEKFFHKINCVDLIPDSKLPILRKYRQDFEDICYIDDDYKNVVLSKFVGIPTFYIRNLHNEEREDQVFHWEEIYKKIIGDKDV